MSRILAIAIMLTLGFSCTKKKKEPEAETPADKVEAPKDETHTKAIDGMAKPDADGAIFEKVKASPVQILKMKEIENKEKKYSFTKENTNKGKAVYLAKCSRCHGIEGQGDGPDERRLSIAPTNLQEWKLKFGSSIKEIVYTITYGRSDGEMPAFLEELSEEELWTVAYYIEAWTSRVN